MGQNLYDNVSPIVQRSYEDRRVHERATLGALIPLIAFSTIFLGLRFYTRVKIVKKVGIDDYLLGISWIFCVSSGFSFYFQITHGVMSGVHLSNLSDAWLRMPWVASGLHWIFKLPLKISLTIFYFTTFRGMRIRTFTYIALILGGLTAVIGTVGAIMAASLTPKWELFHDPTPNTTVDIMYSVLGVLEIATSFLFVLIPLPWLYQLSLNIREKLLVSIAVIAGLLCSTACVITLSKANATFTNPMSASHASNLVIWGSIKGHFAVALIAALGLRPFIELYFPALISEPVDISTVNSDNSKRTINNKFKLHGKEVELPTRAPDGRSRKDSTASTLREPYASMDTKRPSRTNSISTEYDSLQHIMVYARGREAMEAPEYGIPYQPPPPQDTIMYAEPQWGNR